MDPILWRRSANRAQQQELWQLANEYSLSSFLEMAEIFVAFDKTKIKRGIPIFPIHFAPSRPSLSLKQTFAFLPFLATSRSRQNLPSYRSGFSSDLLRQPTDINWLHCPIPTKKTEMSLAQDRSADDAIEPTLCLHIGIIGDDGSIQFGP